MRNGQTRKRKKAARRSREKSILVIQFDSEKLEADGLDLAPFAQAAALFAGSTAVEMVRATTQDDLHTKLATLVGRTFAVVATIGHSNESHIRIAPDAAVSWDAYAEYLKPFEPKRLAIVACRAGQAAPVGRLFARLPKLRRVYATPARANRRMGSVMVLLLPYLVERPVPPRDLLRLLQVGFALDGRQLWEWRRTDWTRTKDDVFTPLFHQLLQDVGEEFVRALSGKQRRA